MKIAKFPETIDIALDRVKLSPSSSEGFAFIGKIYYKKKNNSHHLMFQANLLL